MAKSKLPNNFKPYYRKILLQIAEYKIFFVVLCISQLLVVSSLTMSNSPHDYSE